MTAPQTGFVGLDLSDPLVAWLVYRGEMVSSTQVHERALSFWLTRHMRRAVFAQTRSASFAEELALEQLRSECYSSAVPRLSGFYMFEDEGAARSALTRWGDPDRAETIVEVGLRPGARTSRHDAEWIALDAPPDAGAWMRRYLSGEPSGPAPSWELIVDGRALIYGTPVREAAYETVRSTWPDSLPLLEVARLGVELDSDLGLITAMLTRDQTGTRVEYVMDMRDAHDPGFLRRLSTYEGPVNHADLADQSGRVPDLRERSFTLLG